MTLLDGNYRLDIASAQVKLADGDLANMATDYVFGNQVRADANNDNFFRWYGDDDGNGVTNIFDFSNGFLPAFGTSTTSGPYDEAMDNDGNGVVNIFDFSNGFLPKFGTARP